MIGPQKGSYHHMLARDFLVNLIAAVPYAIHTVLTITGFNSPSARVLNPAAPYRSTGFATRIASSTVLRRYAIPGPMARSSA
jgi:hypothetical protein